MNNYELFQYAKQAVFQQGGDGAVVIVSPNYIELAREFEEIENALNNPEYFVTPSDVCNPIATIAFINREYEQEVIIFMGYLIPDAYEFYDAVIIIPR